MTILSEALRSSLPTASIDDGANATEAFVFTEPPVTPHPDEGNTDREYKDIIVTAVYAAQNELASDATQRAYKGRVVRARRSATRGMQWIGHGYYFDGAEMNPEPVHDHHYRIMSTDTKALVRYDATTGRWWCIKAEGDTPWPAVDDFYSNTPAAYFEVHYSGALTNLDAERVPDVRDIPVDVERFHGKAVVTEDGTVERVTEFVDGTLYVGYIPNEEARWAYFGMKFEGMDTLVPWGKHDARFGGSYVAPALGEQMPTAAVVVWARAALETPADPAGSLFVRTAAQLEEDYAARVQGFEDFNDSLNELARTQSWCGEYERVMQEIGMRSRVTGKIRLMVDVVANIEAEVDSPRYTVSNSLESEYEVDSVSNLRFDARVTVQIPIVVDRDNDYDEGFDEDMSVDAYISSDDVYNEVEGKVGNLTYSVEDWSFDGLTLADNQDDLDD